ncbi:MAG: 4-hydroxy-tetrahydrodipicolinate reductase, partial [Pirellulales bacterium]|nr:4-hydroxy-tetrahydrodipicolinate reductase [Pirellulales bacterium]
MNPVRIAINGAAGRMGQRLIALSNADDQLELAAAVDVANHPRLGDDAGQIAGVGPLGVKLSDTLTAAPDVVIDFSLPEAAGNTVACCLENA